MGDRITSRIALLGHKTLQIWKVKILWCGRQGAASSISDNDFFQIRIPEIKWSRTISSIHRQAAVLFPFGIEADTDGTFAIEDTVSGLKLLVFGIDVNRFQSRPIMESIAPNILDRFGNRNRFCRGIGNKDIEVDRFNRDPLNEVTPKS